MQTSLETLGELERRLTMSVPVAQIESEIAQRLARLAKNAKVAGFRPGKVPMKMVAQQYGPQVRSDVISDAVKATFADAIARAEPAHRGLPADRAQGRGRGTRPARVLGGVRGLSRSAHRRPLRRDHRAAADGGRCRRRRAHDRDVAPAAHALRKGGARRRDGRPGDRRFQRHDRRRRVSGRAGERLRHRPGRGPDAAGIRNRGFRR